MDRERLPWGVGVSVFSVAIAASALVLLGVTFHQWDPGSGGREDGRSDEIWVMPQGDDGYDNRVDVQRDVIEDPVFTFDPEAAEHVIGGGGGGAGSYGSVRGGRRTLVRAGGGSRRVNEPGAAGTGAAPAGRVFYEATQREEYDSLPENPFLRVPHNPLSTFAVDVDTASYTNIRRMLRGGRLPPPAAVRIEEMVNYFDYDYAGPAEGSGQPFAVHTDLADCPWAPGHVLLRVGLQGRTFDSDDRPDSNLVFLIDVSGSMRGENRLPLVQEGLRLLVGELDDRDRVGIVTYAGTSAVALEPTPCDRDGKRRILEVIASLSADGSTAGGAGIQDAYRLAAEHFLEGGANRVILCTDGDFNVGVSHREGLTSLIEEKAESGVFLSVLGFGMGNLQDATLETLADKGNGHYAYIDTMNEATKVLVHDLHATLVTIAKDVKIQVEFNPARVAAYRLVGYENRMLAAEDFNDDAKDAGEIGAGHRVTALYELVPAGADGGRLDAHLEGLAGSVDALTYQRPMQLTEAAREGSEWLRVKLRYKEPEGETSRLITHPVSGEASSFGEADPDFRFAAAVAAFGMALRGSGHQGDLSGAEATPEGIAVLIAQLGDASYDVREEATAALVAIGKRAEPALREALMSDDPEVRSRAQQILSRLPDGFRAAQLDGVLDLINGALGDDPFGYRAELVDLVRTARGLAQGE